MIFTLSAPCNKTQNDGIFPSSVISSISESSSKEIPCILAVFSVSKGNIKCLEIEVGLPTSATDMKPHISIVLDIVNPVSNSKSDFLVYG